MLRIDAGNRGAAVALVAAAIVLVACGGSDKNIQIKSGSASIDASNASLPKRDTTRQLGPDDIRIASTDSAIEIALIGDSLVGGFGARTRDKIKEATDTSKVRGTGFGASIEKMVKSTVAGALDREVQLPLSEISDVKYEDGLLVFYDKSGKRTHFFEHDGDKDASHSKSSRFSEADAASFISAFKAKKTKV